MARRRALVHGTEENEEVQPEPATLAGCTGLQAQGACSAPHLPCTPPHRPHRPHASHLAHAPQVLAGGGGGTKTKKKKKKNKVLLTLTLTLTLSLTTDPELTTSPDPSPSPSPSPNRTLTRFSQRARRPGGAIRAGKTRTEQQRAVICVYYLAINRLS